MELYQQTLVVNICLSLFLSELVKTIKLYSVVLQFTNAKIEVVGCINVCVEVRAYGGHKNSLYTLCIL